MNEYHKIQTVFKRDPENHHKTLLDGQYSLPEFEYLASNKWVFTEKVDGTNIRVAFHGDRVAFGGRTSKAQIPATLVDRLNELFLPKAGEFGDDYVCLYGEGYGDKIQKGKLYSPTQEFVLFDVKIGDWWLRRDDVEDIAVRLGIDVVPIVGTGTLQDMVNNAKEGIKSTWGDFQAEGYVARPEVELKARNGDRIITKIKSRDFQQ